MAEWLPVGFTAGRQRRTSPVRLLLESLEDRCVPATITVLNSNDTGAGSLRQAITDANTTATADTIVFDPSLVGQTITLATALPAIANPLTINGLVDAQGNNLGVTISGNNAVQPFVINGGVVASINDLTITRGLTAAAVEGGGILNKGSLTLNDVTISQCTGTGGGGAIENDPAASLTITNSTLTSNTAGSAGGGIDNFGTAIISTTSITDNLTTAGNNGGGVENRAGATATFRSCTISGNTAGTSGGGIRNISASGAALSVINSTIAYNVSRGAAATEGGGGISTTAGTTIVLNCTIANNVDVFAAAGNAGGISLTGTGTVALTNSILSENTSTTAANNNRNTTAGFTDTNVLVTDNNVVGPLQNNGGPTLTMLPLIGTTAIDGGSNAAASSAALTTDQRGFLRVVGTNVDIGAVEFQPGSTSTTLTITQPSPTPFHVPITLTASVKPVATGPNNPVTGTVTFLDTNGTTTITLGTSTLDANGNTTFTTTMAVPLPVGSNSITARYGGDVNFKPSVSAPSTQVVKIEATTPGNFDPTSDTWLLRNSNTSGPADITFSTGGSGLLAITGDWNGTGVFTPGTFDPNTATFKLYNTNAAGATPFATFQFGPANGKGIPVAGDWNGSGKYGIGVFDPTLGIWDLRNELSAGIPDAGNLNYGAIGSKPVVGDWNGDGITDLGVVEPDGTWKLKITPTLPQIHQVTGPPDFTFKFGTFNDQVFAGDWTGSGIWSPGVVESFNGVATWLERNSNTQGAADTTFAFGSTANQPVVGTWKFV